MNATIGSEGAWSTVDEEQTEDIGVEILATAASGQGLDAEAGARQVEPTAQLQSVERSKAPERVAIEEISTVQAHTTLRITQFWISDVVDGIIESVLDEMTELPVPMAPTASFVPPAVSELMEEVVAAAVERAVISAVADFDPTPPGSPQTESESSSRPASADIVPELNPEAEILCEERLEELRRNPEGPPMMPPPLEDDLLPPLTLAEIDLEASAERKENADMIRTMLLEMADGVERIMEKTQAFLSGRTSDAWGTDLHHTHGRTGEFQDGSREDTVRHSVGDNVFDDTTGMATMVTRRDRIFSIG